MALRMNLKTSREIFSVLNTYNKKITRLNKKGGYITPDTLTFEDVLKNVKNRKELNRTLKALRLYSKRGIEDTITNKGGYTTSRYNVELARKIQSRNRQKITRRINIIGNVKPTTYGKKDTDYTYAQMGDSTVENLKLRQEKLKKDITRMSRSEFEDYRNYLETVDQIDYNYRDKAYMNNYLNEMIFNLGNAVAFDREKIETMRETILSKLSDSEIVEMMRGEESIKSLSEWYPIIHEAKGLNSGNIGLIREEFEELYGNLNKIIKSYKS